MMRVAGLTAMALAVLGLGACSRVSGLETRARILSEPPCTDFFFPIYFAGRSADLSAPARGVIANAGHHANGCTVSSVEVTGLADYNGPADANLTLSRARARTVADALQKAGLPGAEFHLSALGEDGAVRNGKPEPLRRRADVYIRFMH
jgi:peptidoglycan-associated lipoprotein